MSRPKTSSIIGILHIYRLFCLLMSRFQHYRHLVEWKKAFCVLTASPKNSKNLGIQTKLKPLTHWGLAAYHLLGCGAGGNRTRVQTRKPYAFYTLIPDFDFRACSKTWTTNWSLIPWISSLRRGPEWLFPIYLRRWILGFGTTSLERRLVLSPGDGIEPQSTMLRLGSESILVVAN